MLDRKGIGDVWRAALRRAKWVLGLILLVLLVGLFFGERAYPVDGAGRVICPRCGHEVMQILMEGKAILIEPGTLQTGEDGRHFGLKHDPRCPAPITSERTNYAKLISSLVHCHSMILG